MSRSLLQNIYMFKSLTGQEIDAISRLAESKGFNVGETIFLKGEPAKAMYFIKNGTVRIQQSVKSGDNVTVATLSAGSHFGEMAFIDGEPRSATAEATEPVEVVALPYDKLADYMDENPLVAAKFYRELAWFLCGRLRVTTSDLNFVREKNLTHF